VARPPPKCFALKPSLQPGAMKSWEGAASQTLLPGRGLGKPGFPSSQPRLGAAGAPPRQGEWGNPVSPVPNRWWERLAPPGRGMGKPGFPSSQPRLGAAGPPGQGEWGNPVSPVPNRGWERLAPPGRGNGETRFPQFPTAVGSGWRPHRQGEWGNPVSPVPNRGWERLAPPQAGGRGKPGFPSSQPRLGAAGPPGQGEWGNPVSPVPNRGWERLAPPGRGNGETRFPHVPTAVGSGWRPPQAGGMGKPGFPSSQPRLGAAGAPTGRGPVRQAHRRWGNPVAPYVHIRSCRNTNQRV